MLFFQNLSSDVASMVRSTSRYIKFKAASSCYRRFQEAQQRSSRLILLLCSSNRSFDRQRIQKHEGTKKPGPSVRLTHSRSRKKLKPRTGICWIMFPAHTHVLQGFFEREIVFFFPFSILEFDTFGCIISIPRPTICDVIRGLPRNASDLRYQN